MADYPVVIVLTFTPETLISLDNTHVNSIKLAN